MNELALFAGAGGGILGGHLLGWRTVCAVEIDPYAASILVARQNEGFLPPFPIWDDVRTFDGRPWGGVVDVVSGGFPCQDISSAGKGAGITGKRSGLWREMARIIGEVRPQYAFVENSPMLTSRGLGVVLGDLAEMGYNAEWCVLGASDIGAPHRRKRIWILAYTKSARGRGLLPRQRNKGARATDVVGYGEEVSDSKGTRARRLSIRKETEISLIGISGSVSHSDGSGLEKQRGEVSVSEEHETARRSSWWEVEPDVGRVVNGVAARVDRLRAIGNGQVPAVAALAWNILMGRLYVES